MALVAYNFREAELSDLPMLRRWQDRPHVKKWWGDGAPFEEVELDDARVSRWIVELNGRPLGYMQDYSVHGWPDHHFQHLPSGARGIDQYIGDPAMIGRGHGTAFIWQRMQALFAAGVPVIATDPHPENRMAIAAYEKLGFRQIGPSQASAWGTILPMEARSPQGFVPRMKVRSNRK